MKVTLEQIDELRSRVNVSYEEAKSTLERNDGDLIKSIIELEKKKGYKKTNKKEFVGFVDRILQLKFMVKSRSGNTLINIPLILALLTFVLAPWIGFLAIIIILIVGCKIKVYRDKNSLNVNGIKKNVNETVDKIKVKSEKIIQDEEEIIVENKADSEENQENEIIIE